MNRALPISASNNMLTPNISHSEVMIISKTENTLTPFVISFHHTTNQLQLHVDHRGRLAIDATRHLL